MKNKFILLIILSFLLSTITIQTISAEPIINLGKYTRPITIKINNFYHDTIKFFNTEQPKTILGFNIETSIQDSLFTGLFAGLYLWFIYFIIRMKRATLAGFLWGIEVPGEILSKDDENDLLTPGTRWLSLIAGRFYKIFFIAILFTVLIHIPIINRILQVLTLYVFGVHWFYRSIILAIEIGLLPAFIEYYGMTMKKIKVSNRIRKVQRGMKRAEDYDI